MNILDLTLNAAIEKHLDWLRNKQAPKSSIDTKRRRLLNLARHEGLGDKPVSEITADDILSWLNGKRLTPYGRKGYVGSTRSFFDWAGHPFTGKEIPYPTVVRLPIKYLKREEIFYKVDALRVRDFKGNYLIYYRTRAVIALQFCTGLRLREIVWLKWKSINYSIHGLENIRRKGSKIQALVPWVYSDWLVPILKDYWAHCYTLFNIDESSSFALNYKGRCMGYEELERQIKSVLGVTSHVLRKSRATDNKRLGIGLEDTAVMLGDTIEVVNQCYQAVSDEDVARAVQRAMEGYGEGIILESDSIKEIRKEFMELQAGLSELQQDRESDAIKELSERLGRLADKLG